MVVKRITSRQNQYVKLVKLLRHRKGREEKGLFLLEGFRSLEEAAKADFQLEVVLVSTDFKASAQVEEVVASFSEKTPICEVPAQIFAELALTESPQGVLLVAHKKNFTPEQLLLSSHQLLVVADGIQDPGNLGTIIRTAAAAGAGGLFSTRGCVDLYNPKVIRATMGGIFYLPTAAIQDNFYLIDALKEKHYKLVVADLSGQTSYFDADLQGPVVLIIGNENKGPSAEFLQNADLVVKIPLLGPVESLNASVAAGILIYEAVRQQSMPIYPSLPNKDQV